MLNGSPVFRNLIIRDCQSGNGGVGANGDDFVVPGGPSTVNGNSGGAAGDGGAIAVIGGSPRIERVAFVGNRAGTGGLGGRGADGVDAVVLSDVALIGGRGGDGGRGGRGGAVFVSKSGRATIINSVFYGNSSGSGGSGGAGGTGGDGFDNPAGVAGDGADGGPGGDGLQPGEGGGLFVSSGRAEAVHCVFFDNGRAVPGNFGTGGAGGSGGIGAVAGVPGSLGADGTAPDPSSVSAQRWAEARFGLFAVGITDPGLFLRNSIVRAADPASTLPLVNNQSQATFSNIQGGFLGEGNFDADPLFADALNADFHLRPGSPCIDAAGGTEGVEVLLDFDGEPRIYAAGADVGADERFILDGTNEDLTLALFVNDAPEGELPFRAVQSGDVVSLELQSPQQSLVGAPILLGVQPYGLDSGLGPDAMLAGVQLDSAQPLLLLVPFGASTPGAGPVLGASGAITSFGVPPGLEGTVVRFQGFALSASALNTVFPASDAHDAGVL